MTRIKLNEKAQSMFLEYLKKKKEIISRIQKNLGKLVTESIPNYSTPEPPPIPNNNPSIHDLIIQDLQDRKDFGLQKYGTILQVGNGRKTAVDLHQELLDGVVYSRLLIEENKAIIKALLKMASQYLKTEDDLLFSCHMGAGEDALDILEQLGYVTLMGYTHYAFTQKAIDLMDED